MKIGNKIRILREVKNLSTKQMAYSLDMSLAGYTKIERNEDVNIERLEKIGEALGIRPEDILTFDEKYIFSLSGCHATGINQGYININFPEKLRQLYEDKIKLLEEKVSYLEAELSKFKN